MSEPKQPKKNTIEKTEDGHYVIIDGRKWRATNPNLPEEERQKWVNELMSARREVGRAKKAEDETAEKAARERVQTTSTPASAGSSTWKKAAIAGAAVTGYGLVKGKGRVATVGGVATAGSYYMYKKSKKKENSKEAKRQAWYKQRYGKNWRNHYRPS